MGVKTEKMGTTGAPGGVEWGSKRGRGGTGHLWDRRRERLPTESEAWVHFLVPGVSLMPNVCSAPYRLWGCNYVWLSVVRKVPTFKLNLPVIAAGFLLKGRTEVLRMDLLGYSV